jgi:hypothetical protein
MDNACKIPGKENECQHLGMRTLGSFKRRWENNFEVDVARNVRMNLTNVAKDIGQWRGLVNTAMNLQFQ